MKRIPRLGCAIVISALSAGMLTIPARAAEPLNENTIETIGASLKSELESIERAGFDLPAKAQSRLSTSTDTLKTNTKVAKRLSKETAEARSDKERRRADELVILSSTIELVDSEELAPKNQTNRVVVFEYLYTRELPGATGEDAWQELIEYELTIDPATNLVTNLVEKDDEYYDAQQLSQTAPGTGLGSEGAPSSEFSGFDATALDPQSRALTSGQRDKVAQYALKWWNSKNSKYPTNYTNDCTNFTSQALEAGGWKQKLGLWNSNKAWWGRSYGPPHASYPWGGAENFYKFAVVESKRTTIHKKITDARVGDIIQFKNSGKKNMTHSMVVTRKQGNIPMVTYHSTNSKNVPVTELYKSGRTWYAHKI